MFIFIIYSSSFDVLTVISKYMTSILVRVASLVPEDKLPVIGIIIKDLIPCSLEAETVAPYFDFNSGLVTYKI